MSFGISVALVGGSALEREYAVKSSKAKLGRLISSHPVVHFHIHNYPYWPSLARGRFESPVFDCLDGVLIQAESGGFNDLNIFRRSRLRERELQDGYALVSKPSRQIRILRLTMLDYLWRLDVAADAINRSALRRGHHFGVVRASPFA